MSDLFADSSTAATRSQHRSAVTGTHDGDLPCSIELELVVNDRDVIRALVAYPDEDARNQYVLEALKIGVLALRHVGGEATADLIQRESARLVKDMQQTLQHHMQLVHGRLADSLKEYFDPQSGRFPEHVSRLVNKDGELAKLLMSQIDGDNSQLAQTLTAHVGSGSPLMKILDPQQSEGLLSELRKTVEGQLIQQRDHLLKEFSLDNNEGALARLVNELTAKHGDLNSGLQKKIDEIIKEFSLNEEGSALKRLVDSVDRAQKKICDEFSLDNDQSALKRFKKELMTVFQAHVDVSAKFQEEVKIALEKLITKREVEAGTPRHGLQFEDALFEILRTQAEQLGDLAEHTGAKTGLMKGRVIGDVVLELGPESAAPGARVVFEAKERENYSMEKARAEIELARKNRQAEIGVFVFSKKTAPERTRSVARYGADIFVNWDAEDPATDIQLIAALDIARGLCVRQSQRRECAAADFTAIDKAILDVEQRAKNFGEIGGFADKIVGNANEILNRVRIDRKELERQVVLLRESVGDLRTALIS